MRAPIIVAIDAAGCARAPTTRDTSAFARVLPPAGRRRGCMPFMPLYYYSPAVARAGLARRRIENRSAGRDFERPLYGLYAR